MDLTKSQKLLYTIIQETNGIDDKIKLAKFQYFSDFIHYAFNDEPISDIESIYEKRTYGPLARSFNADLNVLVRSGLIEKKGQFEYCPKDNVNVGLDAKEIKTVKYVLNKYANYSYNILADITHKQIPYLSANEGGVVEYNTAYNLVEEYPDYQNA